MPRLGRLVFAWVFLVPILKGIPGLSLRRVGGEWSFVRGTPRIPPTLLEKAIPGGLLQPALQSLLDPIAQLLELVTQPARFLAHLLPPTPGATQELLTDAGAGQGKVVETLQGRDHPAGLLIHDPLGAEAPATGARQTGIATGHQVVENPAGAQHHGGIDHGAQRCLIGSEEGGTDQGGQLLENPGLRVRALALHKALALGKTPELIEPPHPTGRP